MPQMRRSGQKHMLLLSKDLKCDVLFSLVCLEASRLRILYYVLDPFGRFMMSKAKLRVQRKSMRVEIYEVSRERNVEGI
jgi:hypothetical protein